MSKKKDAPPLTADEALALIEKSMREPGIGPSTFVKLEAARSKLLKKQAKTEQESPSKELRTFTVKACSCCHPNGEVTFTLEPGEEEKYRSMISDSINPQLPDGVSREDWILWNIEEEAQGARWGLLECKKPKPSATPQAARRVQPVATEIPRHPSEFAVEDVELHPLAKKAREDRLREEQERRENPEIIV